MEMMERAKRVAAVIVVFFLDSFIISVLCMAQVQASAASVALRGNLPAEAAIYTPIAYADPSMPLTMRIDLALHNRGALDRLLAEQQDPTSPQYHRWLTAAQFDAEFGPTRQDFDAVTNWITSQGFKITDSSLPPRYIQFTGSVSQAQQTFATTIMLFGNGRNFANMTEPRIPAQFDGVIGAISGLDNFIMALPAITPPAALSESTVSAPAALNFGGRLDLAALFEQGPALESPMVSDPGSQPQVKVGGMGPGFGPSDLYSFYNESPLLSGGINGAGKDCIATVEDSEILPAVLPLFNKTFGLPDSPSITEVQVTMTNPGITGDELLASADLEWSHAVAPGAAQRFYVGNTAEVGSAIAIASGINAAVSENACSTVAISYFFCGGTASFYTNTLDAIYAKGEAQGQTIVSTTGPSGAAGNVVDPTTQKCVVGDARNVNEGSADPHVTAVGTTEFTPNYDASGDNVGHVPEKVYNQTGGASGGGPSTYFSKPTWQKGPGVPADGTRDVPDVAMWGGGTKTPGFFVAADNSGTATIICCGGSVGIAAQTWAGLAKLIGQLGGGRVGNLNPTIYKLAQGGLATNGFRDVTSGNNTFNGITGYTAGPNYDLASGWGTVDLTTFAYRYLGKPLPTATPTPTPTRIPTRTPTPTATRTPSPTPTPKPGTPVISSIPGTIQVGSSFIVNGSGFTPGSVVNFFVATATGPKNEGPLTPSAHVTTKLTVPVPADISLGQGFVSVQVVNTDKGFLASNLAYALLQGSPAAGIPSLTKINGMGLAATSSDPSFATDNVETVVPQGTVVTLSGSAFDTINGVAIDLFCACPGGKVGPFFLNPGSAGLSATLLKFTLPASGANSPPTGPGSFVVSNKGAGGLYDKKSNAVSAVIGARIAVSSVSQVGSTITVNGMGFSKLTVINFFNKQGAVAVNLGGLKPDGSPMIPLTFLSNTKFTFSKPAGAVAGPCYVQALNPPFVPFSSSGTGPGGSFTLK
jgi:Pro-kumamolisin, activation domain